MSALPVLPSTPGLGAVIDKPLAIGALVTYTRVPDGNYSLRYDVALNGIPRGKLVLLIAPVSGERLWLALSNDDQVLSSPVSSEREAARFILPIKPVC